MRVVALFRVSTEKQVTEGSSLDAQERIYDEFAAQRGWETVAKFKGQESATQAVSDRRVLQQVLAAIREHDVDAIYVHEQSRLTRGDELEVATLFRELKERNTKVIIGGGSPRDLASIEDSFMLGIQSLVDRTEALRIRERFARGRKQRALEGKKTGGAAPYGYRNPRPGEPGRGKLVIVEEEAPTIRRIFELAARGLGARAIAVELNARGLPAARGGKWCKTSIQNIVQNPAYVGTAASGVWLRHKGKKGQFRFDLTNPKAIVVPNAHPAIIEQAVWHAVRGRGKRPTTGKPRMLTGLLFVDGRPYGGDSGEGAMFYRAPRGVHGGAWLDKDEVDEAVWNAFTSLATSPDYVESLMREAANPNQQAIAAAEVDRLTGMVAKLQRRADKYVEMRADGDLTREQFLAKSTETTNEIALLEKELADQRARAVVLDASHAQRVVRAVQTLLSGRTRLTTMQKRALIQTVVRRVDLTVRRTAAPFARDAAGRVLPGKAVTWAVLGVNFDLKLAPGAAATAPHGPTSAVGAPDGGLCQLVPTSQNCGLLAERENPTPSGVGTGHSDTRSFWSARPAPERP